MLRVCVCFSTWMTTWQSCLSASCSAALMMLWSGEDQRRTVCIYVCITNVYFCSHKWEILCTISIIHHQTNHGKVLLFVYGCQSCTGCRYNRKIIVNPRVYSLGRDDQAVSEGRRLGRSGLPHRGHTPWHLRWAFINRTVPELHPRGRSCNHHHTTGRCAHTCCLWQSFHSETLTAEPLLGNSLTRCFFSMFDSLYRFSFPQTTPSNNDAYCDLAVSQRSMGQS